MNRRLPSWLIDRETREAAYALAVGLLANGLVGVASAEARAAGALTAALQSFALAGALGGLVSAMLHFVGQAFAEERPDRLKVTRAAVEGVCSVIVGAIVAHYFTAYAARWTPRVDPADLLWLAWAMGVFAWRVMPGLMATVQLLLQPKVLLSLLRDALNRAFSGPGASQ